MWAREQHETLGEYDEIYIEFGVDTKVKRGERFTIYREEEELDHPETGDLVGHRIRHLGIARVLDADQHYVKALILRSYEEIERGDLVTSIFPHSWVVGPVTNKSELTGMLIDFVEPGTMSGQFQYVYLDRGRNDGVERGNRFVRRRGDGTWEDDNEDGDYIDAFPWGGEVMVEAFESASLGRSEHLELEIGDQLFMQRLRGYEEASSSQSKSIVSIPRMRRLGRHPRRPIKLLALPVAPVGSERHPRMVKASQDARPHGWDGEGLCGQPLPRSVRRRRQRSPQGPSVPCRR